MGKSIAVKTMFRDVILSLLCFHYNNKLLNIAGIDRNLSIPLVLRIDDLTKAYFKHFMRINKVVFVLSLVIILELMFRCLYSIFSAIPIKHFDINDTSCCLY